MTITNTINRITRYATEATTAADALTLLGWDGSEAINLDTAALRDLYRNLRTVLVRDNEEIVKADAWVMGDAPALPADRNGNRESVAWVVAMIMHSQHDHCDDEVEDYGPSYAQAIAASWEC
jgi:hypothetical protein